MFEDIGKAIAKESPTNQAILAFTAATVGIDLISGWGYDLMVENPITSVGVTSAAAVGGTKVAGLW